MKQSINRFISAFNLPCKFKINIQKITQLSKKRFCGQCLELYHTPRTDYLNPHKAIESIKKEGFKIQSPYGNKGSGVYFSSSPRYQWMWMGDHNPIIISEILYSGETDEVQRFRAEIPPGFEYVVSNPNLIIPKYSIEYSIEGPRRELFIDGWTVYNLPGKFGCSECDPQKIRCDCKLEPTLFPKDNIIIRT